VFLCASASLRESNWFRPKAGLGKSAQSADEDGWQLSVPSCQLRPETTLGRSHVSRRNVAFL